MTLAKKDNPNEILPEAYMISDLGTAMYRDGVFAEEQEHQTKMNITQSTKQTIVPNVLMGGTPQKEVEHEFFLIQVNHGQPKNNKFAILKNYDFPPLNRKTSSSRQDIKKYISKYGRKPLNERYSNFQLILYLSKEMDIDVGLGLFSRSLS